MDDMEKSITSFEMKKMVGYLIIYWTFFNPFIKDFLTLLLCKINILDIFDIGDFFKFLLFAE